MAAVPAEHHESTHLVKSTSARSGVVEISQSRAVAEVSASMMLARRFPRDEIAARDKIVNAFTRSSLAEVSKYSYARGGTDIEGASIHSLQAIARLWGNIRCGVEEVSRGNGQSECRAYAMDMETGFYDEKTFVVRHVRDTKQGPKPLSDERDLYELIANMGARRKRACLEAVIPDDVIEEAMNQAEVTLKTQFEIKPEFLARLQSAFDKYGVTKQMIELRIQRHIDAMTPAQAVQLKKIHMSLKDGMSKPEDWFDMTAGANPASPAPPASRTEQVKEKIRKNRAPAEPAPVHDAATSSSDPPAGPEPITDEVKALRMIETAPDDGAAAAVLDLCVGQPFYKNAVEAFNAQWARTVE